MTLFNDGWQFALNKQEGWTPVKIPHDWLIADTQNLYKSGTGWYKRELDASFLEDGQRLFLRFDGVYMDSVLYVNGQTVGEWKYGYTEFEYDITDFLNHTTVNTIMLKVQYQSPNDRWYSGAGIYRDVFVVVKNECHFITNGIYITTYKQDDEWGYNVNAEVETGGKPYTLRHTLLNASELIEAWDVEHPRLYTLRSELIVDGLVVDTENTRFGFRTITFTTDSGFFLNGRHMKLNGVCLHHDLGALGAAMNRDAVRRQLELLRNMGVNAIRTAHNPPAKVFMELTDEMGFLVLSEILDIWERPKNKYDYARFFKEWVGRDVASWIRRDRNCPSVIMWSVGNEIYDTHANAKDGAQTLRWLIELVRKHDPDNHAPITLCSNYMPWENTQHCADIVKLIGYNYAEYLYDSHHSAHPDWIIYGSETCSTVQSRGVYHFPLNQAVLADDDLQCSALGNSSTSWGAKSVEACLIADRDCKFSLGQFLWSGQDYIGEPTPYHTKSSYFGHLDTAGFPKDSYYVIKAAWTDYKASPMVHLFPYWDFSPGQMIDVRVCSNAPKVELFLNGVSLGTVVLGDRYIADWRVPYETGELRAVAYDEHDAIIAEMNRHSFGDVAELAIQNETVGELMFSTVSAFDKNDYPVENANCRVTVTVSGGTLLGLDNGDSTDYEPYQNTNSRLLFGGKLLAIVYPDADGTAQVFAEIDKNDIPIRKIELTADDSVIKTQVYPPDASYSDLQWRLTNAAGIDSPLGLLEIADDGKSAKLSPKADGEVFIRCSVNNGRQHAALISIIAINFTGLGKCFLNPYELVSGGLYSDSNVTLTNGNERGVATLRDGESHVGFTDLDFGSFGSNELTIGLFPLSREPFTFEIWEGMPLNGGKFLSEVLYDKGSIWNTYQDIRCVLPKRLSGVTALYFVFRQKVHIKGFTFTKLEKAFEKLIVSENDGIYGDSFIVKEDSVEHIGNNVSIIYDNMDFGRDGTDCIALCWRSSRVTNSVQLIFADSNGESRKMIDLPGSGLYTEANFQLNSRIYGNKTVRLLFLPGCELDLKWIRFSKGEAAYEK